MMSILPSLGRAFATTAEPSPVALLPISELTTDDRAAWADLSRRAIEAHPFASPQFVLPWAECGLTREPLHLLVLRSGEHGEWSAAAVVHQRPPSVTRPLPHLRAIVSPYAFLDQPLIDPAATPATLISLFEHLSAQRRSHALKFGSAVASGDVLRIFDQAAATTGVAVLEDHRRQRPEVDLTDPATADLPSLCSKSRRKTLNRAWKRLCERGRVRYTIRRPAPNDDRPAVQFLLLEGMGWKGACATAMHALEPHRIFFLEMCRRFAADGDVWFGELQVGTTVIASTCNLRSGDTLYAFKIGWHPDYADGSPGYWSEIELARHAVDVDPTLRTIDSCSSPDSYTGHVWPGRKTLTSRIYAWSHRSKTLCAARNRLRHVRGIKSEGP